MSTSSGTANPVNINAITLFCAGFTQEQIANAEDIILGLYFYDTGRNNNGGLDINQSDWRDYTSAFAEDFINPIQNASRAGFVYADTPIIVTRGAVVTNQHPWGAENIATELGILSSAGFAIRPTYREFVEARGRNLARATPPPQTGGKSHKKRRKSRKKRRKSRKKRRKSRSKKRRTKGRKKRKRKK